MTREDKTHYAKGFRHGARGKSPILDNPSYLRGHAAGVQRNKMQAAVYSAMVRAKSPEFRAGYIRAVRDFNRGAILTDRLSARTQDSK